MRSRPPRAPISRWSPRPLPPGAPDGALAGIASSPGIAIGPLRLLGGGAAQEPPPIAEEPAGTPDEEWAALAAARDAVRAEIEQRRERLAREVGAEEAEILDALALVLDDDALLAPARGAIDAGASAARAWADAVAAIAARYQALDDPYQRERAADVIDVGDRVLRALAGTTSSKTEERQERHILVARDLTPIDAAGLDRALVLGIATAAGGPTSHGAILARALGVPAVLGIGASVLEKAEGGDAILDGDAGLLVPAPDAATLRDVPRAQGARCRGGGAGAGRGA